MSEATCGGIRLTEKPKQYNPNLPVITVITVVFNSEKFIERTILSVINHAFTNFEFIIIDGASSDKTLEIIKKYSQQIDYWISEPDNGIYDAMNKGLKLASGDFVWFINSGDEVNHSLNIDDLVKNNWKETDVYIGETMMIDDIGNPIGLRRLRPPKKLSWKSLKRGMLVCHQSFIAKRAIVPNYNVIYKISADYEWVLNILKRSKNIYQSPQIFSNYMTSGMSRSNISKALKERFVIMRKNFGLLPTLYHHIFITFHFFNFLLRHRRF